MTMCYACYTFDMYTLHIFKKVELYSFGRLSKYLNKSKNATCKILIL